MKRLVVKIGSNVLTRPDGTLDVTRVSALVDQVVCLRREGYAVVIVSSGAVACGRTELRLDDDLDSVEQRQLYSAVGQVRLMDLYYRLFRDYGLQVGQILTTKRNFETERERDNQRACMEVMLAHGVVPVVNENDTVSVTELMFTDNDELSGLIAEMVGAQALVLLSNIPGLYDRDPGDPGAQVIRTVRSADDLSGCLLEAKSAFGRGGLFSTDNTARRVAAGGIRVV
ncbi:MAG: glutamate 5-kinase, partial [Bacteroidales bacterium]|nr:glutamate 5-kinase [Bacteroidales bacterium]